MSVATLLRARHVGIRELKDHLSEWLGKQAPLVATDRGQPTHFVVPYDEMIEIVEILEELSDSGLVERVQAARAGYQKGGWVPLVAAERSPRYRRKPSSAR